MQKTDSTGTTTYVGGLYEIYPTSGVAQNVGNLGNGVACQESTTGSGYLMYSQESIHTRFSNPEPMGSIADHFISVIYRNGTWQYDTNSAYATFTPRPSDILVAAVDYTNNTVSSLEGVNSSYEGIQKGYAAGDLTYMANMWNNGYNPNEFQVFGSTITPHASGDVRKTYTFGGQSVAVHKDGVLSYLHSDHLNSANVATDASGNKVTGSDTRYKPFGGTRANAPGNNLPTDRRYTGQREVASLGLYNYNARYYDPYIGRFIQADTIIPNPGNSQDLNRYTYVRNNPLKYVDVNGHFPWVIAGCAIGAGIGYGSQVIDNLNSGMNFGEALTTDIDVYTVIDGALAGTLIGGGIGFLVPLGTMVLGGGATAATATGGAVLGTAATVVTTELMDGDDDELRLLETGGKLVKGALENGGFAQGITPDEITEINRGFEGVTLMGGSSPSSALASASYQNFFWNKAAALTRSIAHSHMFDNGNKRTAHAVLDLLMTRNNIATGVPPQEMQRIINLVATGEVHDVETIAKMLGGF